MRLKRGLALVMSVLLVVPGIVMPIGSVSAKAQTKIVVNKAEEILPYQDTSLSFEERAADLVSRMTLEEKVAQLGYKAAGIERLGVAPYDYWKEALHGVARQGAATSFPTALSMSNTWNTELIYKLADATSTEARARMTDIIFHIGHLRLIWQETRDGEEMKRVWERTHILRVSSVRHL